MIYLDHNATTQPAPEVIEAIVKAHQCAWANPSSSHALGLGARCQLEAARRDLAHSIGITLDNSKELIFTSGGTEALNWVIRSTNGAHCITTGIEHCAVNSCIKGLNLPHTIVHPPVGTYHLIPQDIIDKIEPDTKLICIQLANNETGAIQPVSELGALLSALPTPRPKLLVDASQALGKMEINVNSLNCDFLVIAGHKFYGPRTGALWIRAPDELTPMLFGGGQEFGLRPGTENVADAIGLAAAAKLVTRDLDSLVKQLRNTRDRLYEGLKSISKVTWLSAEPMLPNTLLVSVPGMSDKLEELKKHIIFSTGAACHSGASSSSVLTSCGIGLNHQRDMIRFSTGINTTVDEIDEALVHLAKLIPK